MMHILCCTDTNFVIPMGVMIHSLCVNNPCEKLHFHVIIDESVTEQQKAELQTVVPEDAEISFYLINIENIRQYLVVKVENFPIPIYYRLLMAKILPESVHKILYLDADMIVRHDLSELWNTPLDNIAVAGVQEASGPAQCHRLGYPEEKGYFNSGVLLFNLDFIRSHNITDQYIKYIIENPEKLQCPDQDVINYVLRDKKIPLPLRYNLQEAYLRVPPLVKDNINGDFERDICNPVIVHYNKEKPWNKKCKHPLKNLYYHYKKDTIWANSTYMEKFKYKKLNIPLIIQLKIHVYNLLVLLGLQKKEKIFYREMHLEK